MKMSVERERTIYKEGTIANNLQNKAMRVIGQKCGSFLREQIYLPRIYKLGIGFRFFLSEDFKFAFD